MKTKSKILVLVIGILMLGLTDLCVAGERGERSFRKGGGSGERSGRRYELTEEKIERVMNWLRGKDPQKAKELAGLREKDPAKFRAELMEVKREMFGKKHKGDKGHKGYKGYKDYGDRRRPKMKRGGRDEYICWLEGNYPQEAEKLCRLEGKHPEMYSKKLGRSRERYGRIMRASKKTPKLAAALKEDMELKDKRNELLGELKSASETEKKDLRAELEEVVSQRFDIILKRKQIKYEYMLKRLEGLKRRVEKSETEIGQWRQVKDAKVKERIEGLLNQAEAFDWD